MKVELEVVTIGGQVFLLGGEDSENKNHLIRWDSISAITFDLDNVNIYTLGDSDPLEINIGFEDFINLLKRGGLYGV